MLKKVAFIAAAGLALASSSASAAQVTSNFNVAAQITGTCTLTSAATLDFGTQVSASSQINQTQDLSVDCTSGVDYLIGMDLGGNASGSVRRMASGGNFLNYEVFTDAARTLPYSAINGVNNGQGTGTGSAVNFPVYGAILSQSTPPVGTYTDTLVVTLQY